MTEEEMQKKLGKHLFLKNITIPNITMHGDGKGEYEADLIYFNLKARVVTEIEIKVSIQDFRVVNISNNKREDARYIKRAKKRKDVKALNESEVINYLRIGCMKWVNR